MLNISMKKFMTLSVPCPPIDIQNKFSKIVEKIEGIRSLYQKSLVDLEALYGVLSQQAFKGELDLSRVPLLGRQPAEKEFVATEHFQTSSKHGISINLPDTENLLDALENTEVRNEVISEWLEAYRGQLGTAPFSIQNFMTAAQTRLAELHPDDDFELNANDYEQIKTWVFEALEAGKLTQSFDDAGNSIQLRAAQA